MPWAEEVVTQLKDLASKGLSAAQCAAHFNGMSRNAAVGIAHRRGFQFFGGNGAYTGNTHRKAVVRSPPIARASVSRKEAIPVEPPKMVTLEQLGPNDCRYVFGKMQDHPPYLFCGAKGYPWCPTHWKLCYETAQERRHAREEQGRSGSSGRVSYTLRDSRNF